MLTLTDSESSLVIAPETGGSVVGWLRGNTAMLRRGLPQAVMGDPHAMGCFPLLPYANRIGYARFAWKGMECRLARNFGDSPHSIHGLAWLRAWTVRQVSDSTATLVLRHVPDESWPFAFDAEITYQLVGGVLTVSLAMTNRDHGLAPAGIGLHPYFPNARGPSLRFNATGVWENGVDALPFRHLPVPSEWSFHQGMPVSQARLDNCFTGWDGTADIQAGPASLRVHASSVFRHLQVFTPHWADFFCVEPVSHVPNAINGSDMMHVLAPGETLSGQVSFSPSYQRA